MASTTVANAGTTQTNSGVSRIKSKVSGGLQPGATEGATSYPAYLARLRAAGQNLADGSEVSLPTSFPRSDHHYSDIPWSVLKEIVSTTGVRTVGLQIDNGFSETRTVSGGRGRNLTLARYNCVGYISFHRQFSGMVMSFGNQQLRFKGARAPAGNTLSFHATLGSPGSTVTQLISILQATAFQNQTIQLFDLQLHSGTVESTFLAQQYASQQLQDLRREPGLYDKRIAAYNRTQGITT